MIKAGVQPCPKCGSFEEETFKGRLVEITACENCGTTKKEKIIKQPKGGVGENVRVR